MTVTVRQRSVERQMLDAIGEAVMATDADGSITYANSAAASRFRSDAPDDLLGLPIHDLLTPTASRRELQEIAETMVAGGTWSGVLTGRRLDGTTFPHRVTLSPRFDEAGAIVGTVGVGRDLTPEVAAAARVRESELRFQRIFDENPVAMGLVGTDLRMQRSNAALERLLGYSGTELAGRTLASITHPDDVAEEQSRLDVLLTGDADRDQLQKRFVCSDGSVVVGRVTATVVRDDDGEPLYGIGTVEDLTATIGAFTEIQEQKARLAQTLEAAGVATFDLDLVALTQTVSDNYADVLGIPFDEVPVTLDEVLAMVHPDDQHLFLEANPEAGDRDRFDVEFRLVLPGSRLAWIGCKGSFVRDEAGGVVAIRGTMVDLTRERDVEIRRVAAEERYRQTVEAANDAFVGVDGDGRICEWNAAATRMFGWERDEAIGLSVLDHLIPPDRLERYTAGWKQWEALLATGRELPARWEIHVLRRDGTMFPIEMSLVSGVDALDGHVRAFVRDITDRRAHEQRLADQAVTDVLTGLPDRSVLLDRLGASLTGLSGGCIGVLFVDVDRFKSVNDELGHDAGDQLLTSVGHRLRGAVRPTDTVARLGGDEFAVVCPELVDPAAARQVGERVLAALEAPLPLGAEQHRVTVSIGVAVATDPGTAPDEVLHAADLAMYQAKKAGGGRLAVAGN